MKSKILLTIAIFFSITVTTYSQINKGNIFLGGDVGFVSSKTNDESFYSRQQDINVDIRIGKVIQQNTVAGFLGSYTYIKNIGFFETDSNYNTTNGFSAGIFYRKYKRLLKDFYFFWRNRRIVWLLKYSSERFWK